MQISHKKFGVLFSYTTIFANLLVNLFFIPYLINSVGEADYGIYKIASSFSSQLAIINFGIGTVVARGIAKYNVLNDKDAKSNFLFMNGIISAIISAGMLLIGVIMYFSMDFLFQDSLTTAELALAKKVFIISIISTAISVSKDLFTGIINGNEKFGVTGFLKIFRIIVRITVMVVMIKLRFGVLSIALAELSASVGIILIEALYSLINLREKIKYIKWNRAEFFEILGFALALCLQAIVNQVNMTLDSTILGAVLTENVGVTVTIYSVALIILSNFGSICDNISSVFTPQTTKLVYSNAPVEDLLNLVIKIGRIQMMIGSCLVGLFVLFGKEFLNLWMGENFEKAYIPAIILIVPTLLPLVQSVTNAILDAKGKRMFKSLVLFGSAIINVVLSVIFIKQIGFIGAAIGTCLSILIGQGIIMNIYYHKVLKLNVFKMFKGILDKTLPVFIGITLLFIPISVYAPYSIPLFVVKCGAYVGILFLALYFIAMRENEKQLFKSVFNILKRLKNKIKS